MTRREAQNILNISGNTSKADIREAHRKLMLVLVEEKELSTLGASADKKCGC